MRWRPSRQRTPPRNRRGRLSARVRRREEYARLQRLWHSKRKDAGATALRRTRKTMGSSSSVSETRERCSSPVPRCATPCELCDPSPDRFTSHNALQRLDWAVAVVRLAHLLGPTPSLLLGRVTFIPKVDDPQTPRDFRPITVGSVLSELATEYLLRVG